MFEFGNSGNRGGACAVFRGLGCRPSHVDVSVPGRRRDSDSSYFRYDGLIEVRLVEMDRCGRRPDRVSEFLREVCSIHTFCSLLMCME